MPATHTPSFDVARALGSYPSTSCPTAARSTSSYTVLGSGKTAVDACMWLLDNDVAAGTDPLGPAAGRVVPRPASFPAARAGRRDHGGHLPRRRGRRAGGETSTNCSSGSRHRGGSSRIDPSRPATMYRGTMLSASRARRPAADRGRRQARTRAADRGRPDRPRARRGRDRARRPARGLHGARPAQRARHADLPARPDRAPAGAAELAVLQRRARRASSRPTGDDDAEKNRLCPPNPYASSIEDWPRMMSLTWGTEYRWLSEPDVAAWVAESRAQPARARYPITWPSRPCRPPFSAI